VRSKVGGRKKKPPAKKVPQLIFFQKTGRTQPTPGQLGKELYKKMAPPNQ